MGCPTQEIICRGGLTLPCQVYSVYIYIIGVARYTDFMVRYVPRFGGHGSMQFRYNRGKKEIYYAQFIFIYFERTVMQIKKNPHRCENTNY